MWTKKPQKRKITAEMSVGKTDDFEMFSPKMESKTLEKLTEEYTKELNLC